MGCLAPRNLSDRPFATRLALLAEQGQGRDPAGRAEQSDRERAGGGKGGGRQRMSRVLGISVPVGVRATLRAASRPPAGPWKRLPQGPASLGRRLCWTEGSCRTKADHPASMRPEKARGHGQ